MPKKIDLTGQRFGRLTVIEEDKPKYYGKQRVVIWKCKCDCGNVLPVRAGALRNGNTQSCGCLNKDRIFETKAHDLTGKKFGMLTVLKMCEERSASGRIMYECRCDCGNVKRILGSNLTTGYSKSCGCVRDENALLSHIKHGESHTRLYRVWQGMRERCYNPNHISYDLYGGRGITVCDIWNESYESFKSWAEANGYDWYADRGECTLDRIDPNGSYCPENCRWADMKTQSQNRRNQKLITK